MSDTPLYEQLLQTSHPNSGGKVRASAAVVPWRRRMGKLEVYWVRRSPDVPFMAGWWAFPGGGLSRRDVGVPVDGQPQGTSQSTTSFPSPGLDDDSAAALGPDLVPGLLGSAVRELFEETGLLLARRAAASPDDGYHLDGDGASLEAERLRLRAKEIVWGSWVDEQGLRLDASPLVFAGRWLTPPFVSVRFDNRFFLLQWPAEKPLQPSIDAWELDRGEWIEPAEALARWRRGDILTAPPILHILRVLAEDGPEEGLGRLAHPLETCLGPLRKVEFRPGIVLLPLETPTLPPANRTNAFLLGRKEAVLVDPATPLEHEQARLLAALEAARDQGYEIQAIWLTHHHPDHIGAVERVRAAFGVPVLAHADTARILEARGMAIDGHLEDGQLVVLGGEPDLPLRIHHTPGHAQGHLAFFDERSRTLLAGDLVSTLSTIVIDPPDGNMDDYLQSLERMAELEPSCLFPSHGPGSLEAVKILEEFRQHRLQREAAIAAAYRDGKTTPSAMVAEVYAETPTFLHPVAERQILAHLERLRKLGEI